jgi:prohibitin 2
MFVISVLAVFVLIVAVSFYISSYVNGYSALKKYRRRLAVAGIIALVITLRPFEIIPAGSRGLVFTFGSIANKEIQPGFAFKIPVAQDIKIVTVRLQQVEQKVEVGSSAAITKDNQSIGVSMTIFYRYKDGSLVEMWSKYGEEKMKNVLMNTTLESFKADIGTYAIFNLPMHQEEIRRKTIEMARDKMQSYPVELAELKITNYDWSDAFDQQIGETMHRAQQVKQKEQELLITEQEAQKKVKTAEADKQARITTAEGEKAAAQLMAEAKALEGEGIRKYNESVQKNMELEVALRKLEIEKIKAKKWNGQYVPTNNYGPIPVQTGSIHQ